MDGLTNNFTVYFLLLISVVLLTVNCIDFANVIQSWNNSSALSRKVFNTCVKYPLITKSVFSVFSIFTALAITFLSTMLLISFTYFINKLLKPYVKVLCFIFGPLMLGFSIMGFIYWNDVVYLCDGVGNEKVISISNVISIIICFVISVIASFGFGLYEVVIFNIQSILCKDGGSEYVSKWFWSSINKRRVEEDNQIIRNRNEANINNNQENNDRDRLLNNENN